MFEGFALTRADSTSVTLEYHERKGEGRDWAEAEEADEKQEEVGGGRSEQMYNAVSAARVCESFT